MSIVTCSQCGHAAPPDVRQCPKCGTRITSRTRIASSSRFEAGDVIDGRYEVLERLPGGGMGELYKVRHIHLGEFRVIKLLRSDQLSDETQRKRFFQEAKIAAAIKHPNVGLLHDFASLSDGTYYMVEEFIDGLTISRSLRAGRRFTLGEIVEITRQVLLGLVAIHERGIIHRDISPDNIMLCQHENALQARIIDLGIAKPVVAGEGQALTSAGLFIGKPHYASPEQMRMMESEETIDHRTDLYSLGVVIYEMIVGKVPFEAATPLAYLLKQISEEVHTVNRDVSDVVPPALDAFIVRLLKTKRDERFATARETLRALDEVIGNIPQLLYRTEFSHSANEGSFPRATPRQRKKEGTDEIPFAQLAAFIERDRTEPGSSAMPPVDLATTEDDDTTARTEVQSIDGLMSSTQLVGHATEPARTALPTFATREVATPTAGLDRTVPASVPIPSGTRAEGKKPKNRALLIVLASIAFVVVVGAGGWLFYLLLASRLGGGTDGSSVTTTTAPAVGPDTPSTATSTTEAAVAPPVTSTQTATTATVAPANVNPPVVAPATEPRVVKDRPPRPPRNVPAPAPTTTVSTSTVPEPEVPAPAPVEPAEPQLREGDIVAPGEGVVEPQLLKRAEPMAPPSSAVIGNRGFSMFSVLVGIDGSVESVRLIRSSGSAAFDDLSLGAAKKTTYTPATKDGVRVKMWRTLRYEVKARGTM